MNAFCIQKGGKSEQVCLWWSHVLKYLICEEGVKSRLVRPSFLRIILVLVVALQKTVVGRSAALEISVFGFEVAAVGSVFPETSLVKR